MKTYTDFSQVMSDIRERFKESKLVHIGHWQGMDIRDKPHMSRWELFNYFFQYKFPDDLDELKKQVKPNLPWADVHFAERVSREPLNPPPSYKIWPWWRPDSEVTLTSGEFDFSYPERIWPPPIMGIRRTYGNLDDIVELLLKQPYSNQAFLPLFYPEDTGASIKGEGIRTMCSLGYHFMNRDSQLHIFYPMRSCDLIRYFQDDVYLACRILLWVLNELRKRDPGWNSIDSGLLIMHIYSLHIFSGEKQKVSREESFTVQNVD